MSALASNLDQIWDSFEEKICPPRTIVHIRAAVGGLLYPFGQFWTAIVHMRDTIEGALSAEVETGAGMPLVQKWKLARACAIIQ